MTQVASILTCHAHDVTIRHLYSHIIAKLWDVECLDVPVGSTIVRAIISHTEVVGFYQYFPDSHLTF